MDIIDTRLLQEIHRLRLLVLDSSFYSFHTETLSLLEEIFLTRLSRELTCRIFLQDNHGPKISIYPDQNQFRSI